FDISDTTAEYAYPNSIHVEKVIDGKLYDVIAVKDYSFKWKDGSPYTFYFLRQNRPPVLKNLNKKNSDGKYCYQRIDNPIGTNPAICHNSMQYINFTNCSVDPDEDYTFILIKDMDNDLIQTNIFKPNASFIGKNVTYTISVYDLSKESDWQEINISVECCGTCCDDTYKGKQPGETCNLASGAMGHCTSNLICK
ncbi:MAG: hypothetical protein GWP09_00980, partial [Nitrospiraceae bacterium]|nr:hypothetical protein [Nitrospiraceae bacterium]